jgi:hypothetical protein
MVCAGEGQGQSVQNVIKLWRLWVFECIELGAHNMQERNVTVFIVDERGFRREQCFAGQCLLWAAVNGVSEHHIQHLQVGIVDSFIFTECWNEHQVFVDDQQQFDGFHRIMVSNWGAPSQLVHHPEEHSGEQFIWADFII